MHFALLLLIVSELHQSGALRQASEIRALGRAEAAQRRPVELTATVTFVGAANRDCFVQDDTAGVYVFPSPFAAGLLPGDRVVVTGVTDPGTFAPMIVPTAVRKIDRGSLPAPELHNLDPDDNRWLDARYVEGRVYVQQYQEEGNRVLFWVATAKGAAVIATPATEASRAGAGALVGAVVRFRGVCSSPKHDPNTGTASAVGRFLVSSLDDIERLPEPRNSGAPIPIANVSRGFATGPAPFASPVAVRGVVTYSAVKGGVQELTVQDGTGAALVRPSRPTELAPGDTVVVRGYFAPWASGIRLEHAVVSRSAPSLPAPPPLPTSADQVIRDQRWGWAVRIEGELVASSEREGERLITCADGDRQFVIAYAGPADPTLGEIEPGSWVSATGVVYPVAAPQEPNAFRLRIHRPADVTVLRPPARPVAESWWTAQRVTQLLVGVGMSGLLVGAWIVALRSQVRRQAAEIRARFEREATLARSLAESRRLEALGRLVGGIAHDFNNLLTVILGAGQLAREQVAGAPPADELLGTMIQAGERGADLTAQLLTFSRQKPITLELLDINDALHQTEALIRPAVGEGVRVTTEYAPDVPLVRVDRGLVTQLVLNLATNARDAMNRSGDLIIRTRAVTTDRPVVRLTVIDTGCGMDEATKARVFEPFFTTKPVGKGTGLGLATVYGIVNSLGGTIALESAVGRGTTFTIDLPGVDRRSAEVPCAPQARTEAPPVVGPILLVDDDPSVRATAAAILQHAGLSVVAADSPASALALTRSVPEPFAVLVTDVVMPELGGPQLAEQIRALSPNVRVLFISGYPREELPDTSQLHEGDRFLHKPFTPAQLLAELRALGADEPGA